MTGREIERLGMTGVSIEANQWDRCGAETGTGEPCMNDKGACPFHSGTRCPGVTQKGRPCKLPPSAYVTGQPYCERHREPTEEEAAMTRRREKVTARIRAAARVPR
jgi:hypothetical protein